MGKAKKTRKFAAAKRVINVNKDTRLKAVKDKIAKQNEKKQRENEGELVRDVYPTLDNPSFQTEMLMDRPQVASSLFFHYNAALGPPYRIILDTNFINFSIQNKIEPIRGMMDCLQAKCIPCITDCVMAELEKLGSKFRIALRIARDERFERLSCMHKGTYADDCIATRVMQHRCYIVATNDQALRRRIRKIPGVPIMFVGRGKYKVERLPMELS